MNLLRSDLFVPSKLVSANDPFVALSIKVEFWAITMISQLTLRKKKHLKFLYYFGKKHSRYCASSNGKKLPIYHFETIRSIALIATCPARNKMITIDNKNGLSADLKYAL